jgi:hypothetical protein
LTLDCERWTLTHSSGWAEPGLALLLGLALPGLGLALLGLGLGLAAMKASSEAETAAEAEPVTETVAEAEPVAEAEVWDDEGDPDGEPAPDDELDGEPDPEADLDGEGGAGVLLEALLGLVVGAGEVEELEAEGDGVGVGVGVGDFDGFGVGVGVGVGVGEDVLEAGSTWHLVLVSLLTLAEDPGLDGAAVSFSVPARAVPGKLASTPRVRKLPASTLKAADRTCARRMRIALPTLLIRVTVCSRWVRRQLGDGWV